MLCGKRRLLPVHGQTERAGGSLQGAGTEISQQMSKILGESFWALKFFFLCECLIVINIFVAGKIL